MINLVYQNKHLVLYILKDLETVFSTPDSIFVIDRMTLHRTGLLRYSLPAISPAGDGV